MQIVKKLFPTKVYTNIEYIYFKNSLVKDTLYIVKQINSCTEHRHLIFCSNMMEVLSAKYCRNPLLQKYYSKILLFYRRRMIFIQNVHEAQITTK